MSKFTSKWLPTIKEYPEYKGINYMMQLLCANTATLRTPQWGGHHGHISIFMKTTL